MPNFTALDMSLPEVAILVAAMVQSSRSGGQDAGCFHPKADIRTEAETQSTDSEDRPFYSITLVATSALRLTKGYGMSARR